MTKPSSSPSDLFGPMFATSEIVAATNGTAWTQAMLDFEAALAHAQARAGVIPAEAARAIAGQCSADLFDPESLARRGADSATPVIPLVRDLTRRVPRSAAPYVHFGATSQDVLDTAAMLIARRALDLVVADLRVAAAECARLAREHRDTLMIARSLLQQALPTTFGRRCAAWLVAILDAVDALERLRRERLAVQFGGPAGTLAPLHGDGIRVMELLATELGLAAPELPWHTDRTRIAELGAALGTASGTLGKIALDVKLHAQTEVGELSEAAPGGSSAMPHKRNPVGAVLITAANTRVPGLVGTVLSAMTQEYERAAGTWQAEWEPLIELFRLVAGTAAHAGSMMGGLRVHTGRMAANVDLTDGLVMAESATSALLRALGRDAAQDLVSGLCQRVVRQRSSLRAEMLASEEVRSALSEREVVDATEPADHLGSVGGFIDRALARQGDQP